MQATELIVITRDRAGNKAWAAGLQAHGYKTLSVPCIETEKIDAKIPALDGFRWIVFTSPRGVKYFRSLIHPNMKLPAAAVIGDQTAEAATAMGFQVQYVCKSPSSKILARELTITPGDKILVIRTAIASHALAGWLLQRGAAVEEVDVYDTRSITDTDKTLERFLQEGAVRAAVFASPSAVAGFRGRAGRGLHIAQATMAIAIGASVAESLRAAGFKYVKIAQVPSLSSIVELL